MFLNQLTFWVALCLFICTSIFLLIKWRKIGSPLLVLIIVILCIYSFGIARYSILGSMRLSSIPTVIGLEVHSEFFSHGDAILESLKSWNKILRGKKPFFTTSDGSQILVDPIGDEKSIKFFKRF